MSRNQALGDDRRIQRSYRLRMIAFLLGVVVIVLLFGTAYQTLATFNRLDIVESERDRWQRPSEVIQAMDLGQGSTAVDFGCGAGYFTLKLSSMVGKRGRVLAVDIRRWPLVFLWVRALLGNRHNVSVIHGEPLDPDLPAGSVDAILIANTYHELRDPRPILEHLFASLRFGGRLVVVDRGPQPAMGEPNKNQVHQHEVSPASVEIAVRQRGFSLISRQDRFVEAHGEIWWLIVAAKPG